MAQMFVLALIFLAFSTLGQCAPVPLVGSGGTTVQQIMGIFTKNLNGRYKVAIKYNALGSGKGREQFILNRVQFIETDVPLSAAEESKLKGKVKITLPFVVQTISVFTYIPGNSQLRLSPVVIAKIFQGQITKWNHPDIKALNPSLSVGAQQAIHVVRRRDSSGTTQLFTRWLQQAAGPTVWRLGSAPIVTFPKTFISAEGSTGVAAAMKSTPFSIGYVGSSVGKFLGLSETAIRNAGGNYLIHTQADPYGAIPRPLPSSTAPWSGVTLLNKRGEKTWPISSFAYILARKNASGFGKTGGVLVSFLRYLMSIRGQTLATTYEFFKLPTDLVNQNLAAINGIILAKGVVPPF